MKYIAFAVTNDLLYDQRMQRICSSLHNNEFTVTLIGRRFNNSSSLQSYNYTQKRLLCKFRRGPFFYIEYTFRLFFWLLFQKVDVICAIDLDTILPVYLVSTIKQIKRVYDAHELFTEQKEIVTRPNVHKIWLKIERFAVPKFKHGYTVNSFIAEELKRRYDVDYQVIRNLPKYYPLLPQQERKKRFIIYQGAVNEGRSFETLIPAMKHIKVRLQVYGTGNFFKQVKKLIVDNKLEDKIDLKGAVLPGALITITSQAFIGITIFEKTGLNQYYSLSNRFFDYIMAGVPQICVNYPEYRLLNDVYHIAYMINDTKEETIATAINDLLENASLYNKFKENCLIARGQLNWGKEKQKLIEFYKKLANT